MDILDRVTQHRAIAFAVYGSSFAIWQMTQLEVLRGGDHQQWFNLLTPVCIVLWVLSAGFLLWQSRKYGRHVEGDELTKVHGSQAIAAGYWAVTLTAALGLVAGSKLALPQQDVLRAILVVAIVVPAMAYVYLERDSDSAE